MKKTYLKPTMQVVLLQHQHQLLVGSPLSTINTTKLSGEDVTTLSGEDEIYIDDDPVGNGFWGR